MRRVRAIAPIAILVCLWAPSTTWAKASRHERKPRRPATLMFRPRFHAVATGVSRFATDGRYVVIAQPNTTTLIDDHTGTKTTLTFPTQCGYGADVGGGSVLTSCVGFSNPPYELFSITTKTWTPVPATPDAIGEVALGTDWIEYYHQTPTTCSEHCVFEHTFQNIATGQMRTLAAWKPGATTIPDLNSPALAARLCAPLRVPQGFGNDLTPPDVAPDPLTFAGRFATGEDWSVLQGGLPELRLVLERCGSHLHQVLSTKLSSSDNQFAINRHALVWTNDQIGPLHGVFLPSLRRFAVKLPSAEAGPLAGIFLTSRSIYVESGAGRVIAAAVPSPPNGR